MDLAVGLAIAAFGPLLVAGILAPFRNDIASANVVLVFVLVVVFGAAAGTRWTGALTAVVAAMSYDFFFTHPYQSLKIENADDILTTLLLLAIGLIVAEIVAYTRRHRAHAETRGDEIDVLRRTAALVASGATPDEVLAAVQDELVGLLSLVECRYEPAPFTSSLPRIERSGAVEGRPSPLARRASSRCRRSARRSRWSHGDAPSAATCSSPTRVVGVSIEERIVAVALVDQVGAALAADRLPPDLQSAPVIANPAVAASRPTPMLAERVHDCSRATRRSPTGRRCRRRRRRTWCRRRRTRCQSPRGRRDRHPGR